MDAPRRYEHSVVGYNSRLDGIQAAVLRVKMKYLDKWVDARRARAKQYGELLSGVDGVTLPTQKPYAKHSYYVYVIRTDDRDAVMAQFKEKGCGCGIHYPGRCTFSRLSARSAGVRAIIRFPRSTRST